MSLIGNLFKDIGNACKDVVQGAVGVAEGVGSLGKGLLTLNPQEALHGVDHMMDSALQAAGGAATLTPEGLAATTLMDGGVAAVQALSSKDSNA